jgi:DNA-binding cell septation regulator SpoVG
MAHFWSIQHPTEKGVSMSTLPQAPEPRNAHIEIISIKTVGSTGPLRAFASVRLGGGIIHDCRVIQQDGQRPWVSLPQREYTHDGQKKYAAVVELSEPLKREVSRAVLAAWERRGDEQW